MSYIDDLNQAASEALAASASATNSAQIMYDVANGGINSTVETDTGLFVDAVAKVINDIRNNLTGSSLTSEREEQTLSENQIKITLNEMTLQSRPLMFIEGSFEEDFTVDLDANTITLGQDFPDGTRVFIIQNIPTEVSTANQSSTRLSRSFSVIPYRDETLRADFINRGFGLGDLTGIGESFAFEGMWGFNRDSSKWVTDIKGNRLEVNINSPAYKYNALTKKLEGIIIEPGSTNLFDYSERLGGQVPIGDPIDWDSITDNPYNFNFERMVSASNITKDHVYETNKNSWSYFFYDDGNYTDTSPQTVSRHKLRPSVDPEITIDINYDPSTSTFSTSSMTGDWEWDFEQITNNLYRVKLTGTLPSGVVSQDIRTSLFTSTDGWIVTGFQNEPGMDWSSSYILTQGAPVERSADVIRRPIGKEFNEQGFTLYTETIQNSETGSVFCLNSSGLNDSIRVGLSSNADNVLFLNSGGNLQSAIPRTDYTSIVENGLNKVALSVDVVNSTLTLSINGEAVSRSFSEFPNLTEMRIGQIGGNNNNINGIVKYFEVLPLPMSSSELNSKTS